MRRRATLLATAALAAASTQAPFRVAAGDDWDLSVAPSINATGNLIFDTVASALQHWPHTRYRNGHALIPGTVPTGTLLYHGRGDSNLPTIPEWTATDPEHSYMFCRSQFPGGRAQSSEGCWHLTLVNTRPLKVLYFDGSSAAKMKDGPMDTQDIVGWGQILPDRFFDERARIVDICDWGKPFGIDGYVRMEMDFEIMLCDFTEGVEVVAMANLVSDRNNRPGRGPRRGPGGPGAPPGEDPPPEGPPRSASLFDEPFVGPRGGSEVVYSGSWHNHYPGDRRIQLDLTSLISFYDTALVPSLVSARFGKERWDHRLLGISPGDVNAVMRRLEAAYTSLPATTSGIDWDTLVKVVVDRFADRLEIVQYILNGTSSDGPNSTETAKRAMRQLHIMLTPYLLHSVVPESTGTAWAAPIFEFCATSHTSYVQRTPALLARFTPSERLILGAVEDVNREICRVVTSMWVLGVQAGLDEAVSVPAVDEIDEDAAKALIRGWKASVANLMAWLDWSVWVKCRPACSFDEICYLPTWPFRLGGDGDATTNFTTCLAEVRNGTWGTDGALDTFGHPVMNISEATAISYDLCLRACGSVSESFNWNIFSAQFTAWLLPYLALVSQLPFGARTRLGNLVSMALTVGSPTLAAYSLALTVLNGHWIAQRFSHLSCPNVRYAVKILSSLQQSPLQVDTENSLLASLIILPENDEYWQEPAEWLNYVHTWSIAAVASIIWVVLAYLFTVIDSFTGHIVTYSTLNSNGQAVGSVFLWLLPIVVAWLQISPKCDDSRVSEAIKRANKLAWVATPNGPPALASTVGTRRAISIRRASGAIHCDEQCTAPIFNYARFIPWTIAVNDVYVAFREASYKLEDHQPVDSQTAWEHGDRTARVRPANRRGSLPQVAAYILPMVKPLAVQLLDHPSMLALGLTWGTIGAAIVVSYYTPAEGIGCRTGSYILYGVASTVVWGIMVTSSLLSHYSTFTSTFNGRYLHTTTTRTAGILAIILRRTAKTLAAFNSIWIIVACLLQFSSVWDRCYCNSSLISLGKHAYSAIDLSAQDIASMNVPWIGGVALACGCATIFMAFVNVFINPVLPE
ncbi:hypothetical protein MKEN_00360000 [Mycena kentingensis (nom. inval.)]|nr:hypothetical protein MKEN_00360000 [Mycena kentingensis (nom. inval.)]